MKTFCVLALMLMSSSAFAELTFCRTIPQGGFSKDATSKDFRHCIEFSGNIAKNGVGTLTDNSDTFFGNPPQKFDYVIDRGTVYTVGESGMKKAYVIDVINNRFQIKAVGDGASVAKGVTFLLDYQSVPQGAVCFLDPMSC